MFSPGSAGGPGSKSDEAETRINNIMKVDTHALLDTLKNLEDKLSNYYRADDVPAWAGSVIPRMEILEMKSSKLEKKQNQMIASGTGGAPGTGGTAGITEIQMEGRIFDRIKNELDTQVGTAKLTLESKVSSISLELDRLHKLLQIRPTTSELQKVVLQIQEIKKTVQGNMNELSSSVELIVKDKVVGEMGSIMDKLKSIDANTSANLKIMLDKMNVITSDMSALRVGVQNSMDVIKFQIDSAGKQMTDHGEKITQQRIDFEEHNEQLNEQFMEVQASHTDLVNSVSVLSGQLNNDLNEARLKMAKHDKDVNDLRLYNQRMEEAVAKKFGTISSAVQELSASYLLDSEQHKTALAELKDVVTGIGEKGEETASQLDILIKGDILTVISNIEARQLEEKKRVTELEEKIGTLGLRLGKMSKGLSTVQEAIEPLEAGMTAHTERLDSMSFENKNNFEAVNKEIQKQVSDLVVVRDEAAVIKTIGLASDQRVKVIQSTMSDLLTQTEAFGKRFGEISITIEREKLEMLKSVQEAEDALKITMLEKHAEIEGAVQNIKENMDLMAHATEHHSTRHNAKSPMKDSKKNGRTPTTKREVGANLLNSAVEGAAIPAVTMEEQLAVAQTHAQFIGDLCINFEEVSIRRSEVPPIPNVIIENVIATVQVLATYVANNADAESVVQVLRANPGEVQYDDLVSSKRHQKLEMFLQEVNILLMNNNKQPGQVRLEAREKFMNMLRMALDLCISKHEQVVVTGNTRVGRVKIPSCIACDRPLLEKVRQDRVKDPLLQAAYESMHRQPTAGNASMYGRIDSKGGGSGLGVPHTSNVQSLTEDSLSGFAPNSSVSSMDELGLTKIVRTKDGRPKLLEAKVTLPSPARDASGTPPNVPNPRRADRGADSKGAYILRGGFKMPKPDAQMSQSASQLPGGL
jgi:ActR/RegA family two-component response regulator